MTAGIRAVHVDAGTKEADRAAAVAGLGNGEVDIIFNVGLFTEGLDVPALAGVLLLRPTKSLGLYLQMCGRALRVAPGKERAVILDHAGNCFRSRFGRRRSGLVTGRPQSKARRKRPRQFESARSASWSSRRRREFVRSAVPFSRPNR